MKSPRRRILNSIVVAALILPGVSIGTAHAADPPIDGDVIVADYDTGEVIGTGSAGLQTFAAPASGPGYTYHGMSPALTRHNGDYTIQIVSSNRVDSLRGALQAAVNDINAQGAASLQIAPATVSTWPAVPPAGTIYLRVDGRQDCGSAPAGAWAGCASIFTQLNPDGRGRTAASGQIWIAGVTLNYTGAQQQHVLVHELGHTLGLAHHDAAYNGQYQVMHPSKYDATTLRAGDLNGLRPLFQNSASVQSRVRAMYADLLGRPVDAGGLASWSSRLAQNGVPYAARGLMSSTEYRTRFLHAAYGAVLGRAADTGGLNTHLASMAAGMTEQDVYVRLWSSEEAWQQAGRNNTTWVTRLYQGVLGRTPSAAEVNTWVSRMATQSRESVARHFLTSQEYAQQYVNRQYQLLLGRNADASGVASWRGLVQNGQQTEVVVNIVKSAEYRQRSLTRFG